MKERILTGITTTGLPHLGNYISIIRPTVDLCKKSNIDMFFLLADYHALIKCKNKKVIKYSCYEILSSILASGVNPNKTTIYRQSYIPEVLELAWFFASLTPKGLMNRSHSYKNHIKKNIKKKLNIDYGINIGLFSYPILMAADILSLKANRVTVGKDQIQHIEITRYIANKFNKLNNYKNKTYLFNLPKALLYNDYILPGIDGRKMSKNYNNTIPLFKGGYLYTKYFVNKIITNSFCFGVCKKSEKSPVYILFKSFSKRKEYKNFNYLLINGMNWNNAKKILLDKIEKNIGNFRYSYKDLIKRADYLEEILLLGNIKARKFLTYNLNKAKKYIGLKYKGK